MILTRDAIPLDARKVLIIATLLLVSVAGAGRSSAIPTPLGEETCDGITLGDVRGTPPSSVRPLATFPNDGAICGAVWVPLLDAGTVPQGVAIVGDGTALISGHINSSPGTARVVQIDLTSGEPIRSKDVPKGGHGGAIQIDSTGAVWVASTNRLLYWPNISAVFASPHERVKISTDAADEPFEASFLTAGASGRLWLGSHQAAEMLKFKTSLLVDAAGTTRVVKRTDALSVITIPSKPEGAEFGPDRFVSSSKSTCGVLTIGTVRFGFGPGSQQIDVAPDGRLWGVFQSGSARYPDAPYFPVLASFDRSLITEEATGCATVGS